LFQRDQLSTAPASNSPGRILENHEAKVFAPRAPGIEWNDADVGETETGEVVVTVPLSKAG